MDISIPASRVQQVTQVIETFIGNFNKQFGPDYTPAQFTAILHPNIRWRDHSFYVQREGHKAILGLHQSFLHCNQPFRAEIKSITPTSEGAVLEQVWIGCCANDIVRPDGTVVVTGSGKNFENAVCMVMKVSQEGLIEQIDEYYNKRWDDGIPESEYHTIKGASLKEAEL